MMCHSAPRLLLLGQVKVYNNVIVQYKSEATVVYCCVNSCYLATHIIFSILLMFKNFKLEILNPKWLGLHPNLRGNFTKEGTRSGDNKSRTSLSFHFANFFLLRIHFVWNFNSKVKFFASSSFPSFCAPIPCITIT